MYYKLISAAVPLLFCVIWVTIANFTKLRLDELTLILSHFETRTAANCRLISSKWNVAYNEMTRWEISDLSETASLFQRLEQHHVFWQDIDEIIIKIHAIRRRNLFKIQITVLIKSFGLLNKWHCRNANGGGYARWQLSMKLGYE